MMVSIAITMVMVTMMILKNIVHISLDATRLFLLEQAFFTDLGSSL